MKTISAPSNAIGSFAARGNLSPVSTLLGANFSNAIYVLKASGQDLYKVGFVKNSSRLNKRIEEIQCGCPFDLEVIAVRPGSRSMESTYHGWMKMFRVRGEWFRWSEWMNLIVDGYQV